MQNYSVHKFQIVLTLLVLSSVAWGQGRLEGGLRTGFWTETFNDANKDHILKGKYKIISSNKYEKIRGLGRGCYEIKYKGATQLVFFIREMGGKMSVKDSIWNSYDMAGNLREVNYWIEGLNQWTKYYDEKGALARYDYEDYENDTSFQLTYIDGQLFKKAFYPPNDKNNQTSIYYPERNLEVSKAELSFSVNFLDRPSDTQRITIRGKKDVTISDISFKSRFVKVTTKEGWPVPLPLYIGANRSVPLKIVVSPQAANYQMTDTLRLVTSEGDIPYSVYLNIYAHHINGRTVEHLDSIQLSKSKDKYLILPSMGTVTDATIVSKNGEKHIYVINNTTWIDLSTYPTDTYLLQISSCNTGGQMRLTITQ